MQKKPLVSVIINCFNGQNFLSKAIESVLDQNYKNWEIVFFDNNSTDNSSLILKNYKDKRIKYFKSKNKLSLYRARNLAIKKAKGTLISFLDVDDWWLKSKLNKQVKFFIKNKNTSVLYSNIYVCDEKKNSKSIYIKKKNNNKNLTQKLVDKFEMPILSTMIKKNIFNQIKFDNRFTIIGDLDFFARLSLIENISFISEPLACYRIHSSNLTQKRIDLNIRELQDWIFEKRKNKNFQSIDFSKLNDSIEILKIQKNLIEGNNLRVLFGILKMPLKFFKLKILN